MGAGMTHRGQADPGQGGGATGAVDKGDSQRAGFAAPGGGPGEQRGAVEAIALIWAGF